MLSMDIVICKEVGIKYLTVSFTYYLRDILIESNLINEINETHML